MMNISFAYTWVMVLGIPSIAIAIWWYLIQRQSITYQFPLVKLFVQQQNIQKRSWQRIMRTLMQAGIFFLLLLATARPRIADERSKIIIEGVATMLVLDVSGSMECFDDPQLRISRFAIAQQEAINFIKQRAHDQYGLVLFGAVALSRCPLTADTPLLADIIRTTKLGMINPQGTVLAMAIAMGVGKLRTSSAVSKIMILLTDGEPSPEDIDVAIALDLAKQVGVKIYTIGIGSESGGFIEHPLAGIMQVPTPLNVKLLQQIAQETGGQFFRAHNQRELETIYQYINELTTSKHEAPQYAHYYELYLYCVFGALLLLALQYILTWRQIFI